MKHALLEHLLNARARREAVALITDIESGEQRVVPLSAAAGDPLGHELVEAFRADRSGMAGSQFVHVHNPPLRLVIIGAVHIAQSLIPIAQQVGYDVVLVDPRGAFATDARFPGMALHVEWPDDVLPRVRLDRRTALVALTHDPKIDDPALIAALRSEVFYVGALGSRKTHASRTTRLAAKGMSQTQIARIHGPIGLSIGARGAPEIAISILAEMTQVLRQGKSG